MASVPPAGSTVYQRRIVQLIVETQGIEQNTRRAAQSLKALDSTVNLLRNSFLAFGAINIGRGLLNLLDTGTRLNNLLGTVTDSTAELTRVQEDLYRVSTQTRSALEASTKLYVKLDIATKQLGASHQQVLDAVESVNIGLKLGGQTAAETSSAILQLSQAFASGRLQGDEFRSVLENAPVLALQLAQALGTTVAGLREMSRAGDLTTEQVFPALLKILPQLRGEFKNFHATAGEAFELLRNEAIRAFQELQDRYDIIGKVSTAIKFLAENIELLAKAVAILGAAWVGAKIGIFVVELAGAIRNAAGLATALGGIATALGGWPALIGAAITAGIALIATLRSASDELQDMLAKVPQMDLGELNKEMDKLQAKRITLFANLQAAQQQSAYWGVKLNDIEQEAFERNEQAIEQLQQRITLLTIENAIKAEAAQKKIETVNEGDLAFQQQTVENRKTIIELQMRIDALKAGDLEREQAIVRQGEIRAKLEEQIKDIVKAGRTPSPADVTLLTNQIRQILDLTDKQKKATDDLTDAQKRGAREAAEALAAQQKAAEEYWDTLLKIAKASLEFTPIADARADLEYQRQRIALMQHFTGTAEEMTAALAELDTQREIDAQVASKQAEASKLGLGFDAAAYREILEALHQEQLAEDTLGKVIERRDKIDEDAQSDRLDRLKSQKEAVDDLIGSLSKLANEADKDKGNVALQQARVNTLKDFKGSAEDARHELEKLNRLRATESEIEEYRADQAAKGVLRTEEGIRATEQEVAAMRARGEQLANLNMLEDKYMDKIQERDRLRTKSAADATREREKQAKEFDKFVTDLASSTPLLDLRPQLDIARERVQLLRTEAGSTQELARASEQLAIKQKVEADITKELEDRRKKKLDTDAAYIQRLRETLTEIEQLRVAEARLAESQGLLQNAAAAQDPRFEQQRQLDRLQQALQDRGPLMNPDELAAAKLQVEELKNAMTGLAQAARELGDIGSPFAGLLEGLNDLEFAFGKQTDDSLQAFAERITKLGTGTLEILGFITQQASALGIESFAFQKAMAIAQATINSALAITSVLAEPLIPFPVKLGLVGLIAGLTGAQIAVIQSQEPPARAYGGVTSAGGAYRVGERGPELFTGASGRQVMIPSEQGKITPVGGGGVVIINQGPPLEVKDESVDENGRTMIIVDRAVKATEAKFADSLRTGKGTFARALTSSTDTKRRV